MEHDTQHRQEDMSDVLTPSEIEERLNTHETRLDTIEHQQKITDGKLDSISHTVTAMRTEGALRQESVAAALERNNVSIAALTNSISEYSGAQKEQLRASENSLRTWKKIAVIVGIIGTIVATLLSDQEIASVLWTKWLRLKEPWDVSEQAQPKTSTQYLIGPDVRLNSTISM